jgi:hypothetical protein
VTGFGITAATFAARVGVTLVNATDVLVTIDGNAEQSITLVGVGLTSRITVADFLLI